MKPSGIGGMAVMEGVMMKNKEEYAVAVRKPDNEIVVQKSIHKDFSEKVRLFKLPIFRGMLAFVDSMVIGVKVLNFSASFFDDEDDSQTGKKKGSEKKKSDLAAKAGLDANEKDSKSNALMMVLAVMLSIALSVALFMVLPALIIELLNKVISNRFLLSLIEGLLRLAIFICYVVLASMLTDIKRVFMYHGAEHKTINCLENGFELTVENVRWQSKQHKRCGTSFMLLVILISLIIFMIFPATGLFWRVISRILLVPFIAGISYEFIRLAGRSDNRLVNILSKPGLWMQGLTTKEPDDAMIEVAIKSVEAVFDWRAFLAENKETAVKKDKAGKKDAPAAAAIRTDRKKTAEACQDNTGGKAKSDEKRVKPKASLADRAEGKASVKAGKDNGGRTETAATADRVKPGQEAKKRNSYTTPIVFKNTVVDSLNDEDDEILLALDKYFVDGDKEQAELSK